MQFGVADKVYRNHGNADVVALVDRCAITVLDVGCGAGDNAALLRRRDPDKLIYGITGSRDEGQLAKRHLDDYWVADLEKGLPSQLDSMKFDCMLFSHVLEHVRDPAGLLSRLLPRLSPGGCIVMAIPNVLYWRERLGFLRGRFEYQETGILDATHLRFFTPRTAVKLLFARTPELSVAQLKVTGDVPLWVLRRKLFSKSLSARIDAWGCSLRPNLFGSQILVKARLGASPSPNLRS